MLSFDFVEESFSFNIICLICVPLEFQRKRQTCLSIASFKSKFPKTYYDERTHSHTGLSESQ